MTRHIFFIRRTESFRLLWPHTNSENDRSAKQLKHLGVSTCVENRLFRTLFSRSARASRAVFGASPDTRRIVARPAGSLRFASDLNRQRPSFGLPGHRHRVPEEQAFPRRPAPRFGQPRRVESISCCKMLIGWSMHMQTSLNRQPLKTWHHLTFFSSLDAPGAAKVPPNGAKGWFHIAGSSKCRQSATGSSKWRQSATGPRNDAKAPRVLEMAPKCY